MEIGFLRLKSVFLLNFLSRASLLLVFYAGSLVILSKFRTLFVLLVLQGLSSASTWAEFTSIDDISN